MQFDVYQDSAAATAIYPEAGSLGGLTYTVLGLANEAGELAGKLKKHLRDDGGHGVTGERRDQMIAELGDVLWYVAMVADELNVSLGDVAAANIAKLSDRASRGVLGGDGDSR